MRILISGGAGFIGSHLADHFLAQDHDVIVVDNLSSGSTRNIAIAGKSPRFTFIQSDVTDPPTIEGKLDWVLHFASLASPPKYLENPISTLRANSEGTYNLLELARQKTARFFLASTSEVYGDPLVHPQLENYWGNVNPIGPRSVYDESKRYAEALTTAYHTKFGLPIRIVRIFNTYGPRMDLHDGRVVTNLIGQALRRDPMTIYGDGRQTRSFQYIDDLRRGIMRLMEVEHTTPINVGNPEEYTILQLAGMVGEILGLQSTLEFHSLPIDDPKQRCPDISLASRVLGWHPIVPVREGLAKTIEHFKAGPCTSQRMATGSLG